MNPAANRGPQPNSGHRPAVMSVKAARHGTRRLPDRHYVKVAVPMLILTMAVSVGLARFSYLSG